MRSFSDLRGHTIHRIEGAEVGSEVLALYASGVIVTLMHKNDCCESVSLNEIIGDINDLIGLPLLEAEEATNQDDPPAGAESHTWTFYKLGTHKGRVTLRWLGESNGYYSEHVHMDVQELDIHEYAALIDKEKL